VRAQNLEASIQVVQRIPVGEISKVAKIIPMRFVPTNKLSRADRLMAAFDAHVLQKAAGVQVGLAKIVHGDNWSTFTLKTSTVSREVEKTIGKVTDLLADASPPDSILNRHCPECEFRDFCKERAVQKDDLSLLSGMTRNERLELHAKGIFTVNQLSYTFRPRRRSKRFAAKPEKYHHSLRALAIRAQRIHVVGNPRLEVPGTPIFFDVEGLPDRDFYYLIGIRLEHEGRVSYHRLWADAPKDEEHIWKRFLGLLSEIDNPVLLFKTKAADYYSDTRMSIRSRIIHGNLIHADETEANVTGHLAYVWVLTNLREVIYILAESREAEFIRKLLEEFNGVLVSDFYAAYDAIDCAQQKCLIHLMRDINDEMLSDPFNEEMKAIGLGFAGLLKPIIETIDRRGLKKYFLRKHLVAVDRFYRFLEKSRFRSETASKCKERFERNRGKLFTFLNYDGVPWNNNNAEHAIKAFGRLRHVISGTSTKKGVEEYLTLLSVSETCEYSGIDFLDFLRSGEKDLERFAGDRGPSKSVARSASLNSVALETIDDVGI
jgi:hypothetical protein